MWVAMRPNKASPFNTPALVSGVNSSYAEAHPSISSNGLQLYFHSDREDPGTNNFDLYVAERSDALSPFGIPINLTSINSLDGESSASINFDGTILFFVSSRPGGQGSNDIWMTGERPQEVSSRFSGMPLFVAREGNFLVLTYEDLINCADRYNVYSGVIDTFYSHQPNPCNVPFVSIGSRTLESRILADSGSKYYLITATKESEEGTSGFDSVGRERNPTLNRCP